jgi:chromate transporter
MVFAELLMLFWIFFKIGLFTFGGGYAMIPLIKTELVGGGYIDFDLLVDFIGISESTPGPIAINMATFIGISQFAPFPYNIIGAVATTLGVALPSFIIILLLAKFGDGILNSKFATRAFTGLKPTVIGLILSVSLILGIRAFLPNIDLRMLLFDFSNFSWRGLVILLLVGFVSLTYKKLTPFRLILLSALLGMIIYSF